MRETQILRGLHKARATLHMQTGGPDWTTRPGANYNSTSGAQQSFDFGPDQNGPQPQGGQQYTNAQAQRPGYSNATDSAERWAENKRAQNAARDWSKPAGGDPAAPPPAPDTPAGPKPKGGMWGGVKNMFTRAAPEAPQVAPEVPLTPAQRAQAWNPKININGDAFKGAAKGAAEFAGKWGRRGGKLAAPLGAALDTADVVDVATDDRMGKLDVANEVASKAGKWGAAGAGAIAGGAAGALAGGGVFSPITAPIGAIGGGLAGYFGADAAIKGMRGLVGTETTDPSERSYGVVSKALGDEDPYAVQKITTRNAPGSRGKGYTDPRVLTAEQLAQNQQPATVTGGDGRQYLPGAVTAEDHAQSDRLINAANLNMPKIGTAGTNAVQDNLRNNAASRDFFNRGLAARGAGIKMSTDANGGVVFSNSTEPEKMPYVDTKGAPTADYKQTRQFAESSAGLRAQPPMNLAWRKQMFDERHDAAKIDLDERRLTHEMRKDAVKGENDDAMLSPFATEIDPVTKERKVSEAAANDLRQFRRANAGRMTTPDGKPVDMVQLRATNPTEHARMSTAQDTAFGLGRLFNKYSKDTTFGAPTGWGMPKISGMREASISDWTKGMSLKDAALAPFKPGYYSQGVEIDLGGSKKIVPIGEILDDQNGGQFREMLNEWRVAHKLPRLGNAVTGE